ncbi:MAG: L-rhamnose isomerase [Pirellulales bacterium]
MKDTKTASFAEASERYAALGVDVGAALGRLASIAVSMQCWQGDDVAGLESVGEAIGGGLAVTGSYPGRARTADELRSDVELAMSLIPGRHRLSLHASYAETGGQQVARNELAAEHFRGWMDWSSDRHVPLDFNPTFFAHPLARDGFTLSHRDAAVRQFWVEHGMASRRIAAAMGANQPSPCVNNLWIPDGMKDLPIDRLGPRQRLVESLDAIFADPYPREQLRDAVESKLFGLGSEAYVVGSHEFYLGYAIRHQLLLCLDAGHFHPTEMISDKISSVLCWIPELLLHVSRGVRWDSDHVVIWTDELQAIAQEVVRGGFLDRVHLGLDFFDASINRVAAWVIGTRALLQAILAALLEPTEMLRRLESEGDYTRRLALLEATKLLPVGSVWEHYCQNSGVPGDWSWMERVRQYEREVLSRR